MFLPQLAWRPAQSGIENRDGCPAISWEEHDSVANNFEVGASQLKVCHLFEKGTKLLCFPLPVAMLMPVLHMSRNLQPSFSRIAPCRKQRFNSGFDDGWTVSSYNTR